MHGYHAKENLTMNLSDKQIIVILLGALIIVLCYLFFIDSKETPIGQKEIPVCDPETEVTEDGVTKGHFYRCPNGLLYYKGLND